MQLQLEVDSANKVDNLFQIFEDIHNHIYANDGLSGQQALEEIIKILFLKFYDENKKSCQFNIGPRELTEIKNHHGSKEFVSRIAELFERTKAEYEDIFDSDEKIHLSITSLAYSIDKIQGISLSASTNDAKGLAFQKFLVNQEKGARGQFFTPEPVIDFCVQFIQPKPSEKIIDPACGSGGFLFASFKYIQRKYAVSSSEIISQNLFGVDINKSIARIARMKFLLEANTKTNIFCANSLDSIEDLGNLLKSSSKNHAIDEGFDIVLTNPPFGTQGKITSSKILLKYELGHKWSCANGKFNKSSSVHSGQVAEILFIERCLSLLKNGGRMAIVLPNGHFENSSLDYLRNFIKERAKILGVVNLPQETFVPFGTGVKTSLLFLEKAANPARQDYKIFFGKVTKLGYEGNKNALPIYKKGRHGENVRDQRGDLVVDEDFSMVLQDYSKFKEGKGAESAISYLIDFSEVNGRLDYDFYSPENQKLVSILKKQNAVRLSEIASVVKNKSKKLSFHSMKAEYVELSDISTYSSEIINSNSYFVHELPSRASYEIREGDIITAIAGNSVGTRKHATALVTKEFDGCICTNGFRVLRDFKIDRYFLIFFFKSEYFLKQMFMYRTGAAIPSISDSDFENLLIQLPNEKIMAEVSAKVKRAFLLREQSRKELESIKI